MVRRKISAVGGLVLAIALLVGSVPARAGEAQWADPAGDATGLSAVESTPRPSEPQLDLLKVSYVGDGKNLTVASQVATLADPVASGGAAYRWYWIYDGITYELILQLPTPPTDTAFIRGPIFKGKGVTLECGGCKARYDVKANTVGITIPISAIARGVKTASPSSPAFAAGAKLESLRSVSQRSMGAALVSVDFAVPKAGTSAGV